MALYLPVIVQDEPIGQLIADTRMRGIIPPSSEAENEQS